MSGAEIIPALLDVPSYIANFAKTCQKIKEYKELDDTHKELMKRAITNSERFSHLTSLIQESGSYPDVTQKYIARLVQQARFAMDRTLRVVDDWTNRLGIKDDASGPRSKRLIPSLSNCFGRKEAKHNVKKSSYIRERVAEVEYLITGKLEIFSSMESLEHWLTDLNFAILSSDRLQLGRDSTHGASDTIEFVVRAKQRAASEVTINWIDAETLEPISGIDSNLSTGIYRVDSGPYSGCIVDPRNMWHYAGQNQEQVAWQETKNIARLFSEDTTDTDYLLCSSVGILPSCGYTELDKHVHAIIFRVPSDVAPPRTLRSLLIEGRLKHSLHDRVDFATKLATSVLVIHSLGIVHKSIRPDSIVITESAFGPPKQLYPYKLGIPYLVAFDSSRTSRGPTMKQTYSVSGSHLWEVLYKHPRHFGYHGRQFSYEMRDDIFSLGICLLELALWKSLFSWNPSSGGFFEVNRSVVDLSEERCRGEAQAQGKPTNTNKMWLRHFLLIEAAEDMIPPIMGDLFKDVVVACLTFGSPSRLARSDVFEMKFEARAGIEPEKQSIAFVEEILTRLRTIKLSESRH